MTRVFTSLGEAKIAVKINNEKGNRTLNYEMTESGVIISDKDGNKARIEILKEKSGLTAEEIATYRNSDEYGKINIAKKILVEKVLGEFGTIEEFGTNKIVTSIGGTSYDETNWQKIIDHMIKANVFSDPSTPNEGEMDALYAIIGFYIDSGRDLEKTKNLLECMLKGVEYDGEITDRGNLYEFINRTPARLDPREYQRNNVKKQVQGANLARGLYRFLQQLNSGLNNKYDGSTIQGRYNAIMNELLPYIDSKVIPVIQGNNSIHTWPTIDTTSSNGTSGMGTKTERRLLILAVYNHYISNKRMRQNTQGHQIGTFQDEWNLFKNIEDGNKAINPQSEGKSEEPHKPKEASAFVDKRSDLAEQAVTNRNRKEKVVIHNI